MYLQMKHKSFVFQDDLRKDCRLMEFNGIVNKFLRKDPESRKRSLNIRTYVSTHKTAQKRLCYTPGIQSM